mmetsp:Transcript_21466/g.46531  ORF Transcript_21466/g.46531 Transcript_21466/m.46531 type:complete len:89 (-) Transcript_21466:187-453(-)
MNALTRAATTQAPRVAAAARAQSTLPLGKFKKETFSKAWMQDSGTYPILVIMSFASFGWVGFLGYKMAYCPSVRITNKTRGQVIRTWK